MGDSREGFWDDVWHEAQRDIVRALGWTKGEDDKTDKQPDKILAARLPKLDTKGLNELLVALAVGRQLHAHTYSRSTPDAPTAMMPRPSRNRSKGMARRRSMASSSNVAERSAKPSSVST